MLVNCGKAWFYGRQLKPPGFGMVRLPARAALTAVAMAWAASGAAQDPATDLARVEAMMVKDGLPTPIGLEPPDTIVAKAVWLKAPITGVAKDRIAARMATRAERLRLFDEADRAWRAIATDAAAREADRSEAGLALVRIGVTRDPAAARTTLAALPKAAQDGIAGQVLAARILLMEGKAAEALAPARQPARDQRANMAVGSSVLRPSSRIAISPACTPPGRRVTSGESRPSSASADRRMA